MSIDNPYQDKEKRLRLEKAFRRVGGWAATNAVIADERGDITARSDWLNTSQAAEVLAGVSRARNLIGMVENALPLRAPFKAVIQKLNGLADLPAGHPDRVDPSLRIAARHITQFRKHIGEGLDCNNPLLVPECRLKR